VLGAIDFHGLGQVIWVSFGAGVGVTVLFSFVIYSNGKSDEARRGGHGGEAALYTSLAVLALVIFATAVIVGVTVMLKKN
jgi:hypothetical protein